MTRHMKSVVGAVRSDCARCGLPCYRQLVGHRAALTVTADTQPYVAGDVRQPGPWRLLWCVARLHGGTVDLRWRCQGRDCAHEHVICHVCPAGTAKTRRPEGAQPC